MADLTTTTELTSDDLLKMPTGAGHRYELVDGALITMAAAGLPHGRVVGRITIWVGGFVLQNQLGTIIGAETGFYTRGNNKTVRAPDMAFIPTSRLSGELEGYSRIVPDLVVEVASPNDRADEISKKTREWLKFGVAVVWNVYPDDETVHIHTDQDQNNPVVLKIDDFIDGGSILPGFRLAVKAFFKD